jgi:hypothetical protein
MTKWRFLIALLFLSLLLTACVSPSSPSDEPEIDTHAASVERLCDAMGLDELHATALLDLLAQMDAVGEVLFAYPATDEAEQPYYHIWIGEQTVDVYMETDGRVAAVLKSGIVLYGELPAPAEPPSDDSPTDDLPEEPVVLTISVESHTASVEAGCDGYVRAFGEAGVEYKIKVYYASGVSTAKALSPQVAAQDGSLVWEWTVSSRVKPGTYKIILVRCDDERDMITLPFEVTAPGEE